MEFKNNVVYVMTNTEGILEMWAIMNRIIQLTNRNADILVDFTDMWMLLFLDGIFFVFWLCMRVFGDTLVVMLLWSLSLLIVLDLIFMYDMMSKIRVAEIANMVGIPMRAFTIPSCVIFSSPEIQYCKKNITLGSACFTRSKSQYGQHKSNEHQKDMENNITALNKVP